MAYESSASFIRCEFADNASGGRGGGLHATRGAPVIERSALVGNTAISAGGGVSWLAGPTPMTLRRVALAANDSKVGGTAAWVRPGFDNLLLDDVAICGSGTQPILGGFTTVGPYTVVSLCEDCNDNGEVDFAEVMIERTQDCNDNLVPDSCDIADGLEQDCNANGIPDACEVASGAARDCNGNGVPDDCDIANGTSADRNGAAAPSDGCVEVGNGVPDECEIGEVIRLAYPKECGQHSSCEFDTWSLIEAAICGAVDGMIIELEPGVWFTSAGEFYGANGIDLGSKRVTIRSVAGPAETILQGRSSPTFASRSVVSIGPSEPSDDLRPILQGLTIRFGEWGVPFPGSALPVGGGVRLLDTHALIDDCIIELNYAGGGGGVAIRGGAPTIRNSIIRHNDSTGPGAGIMLIDTEATIEDSTIFDNIAIGRGGGLYAVGGRPTVRRTLVDLNDSASQGGGIAWMGTSIPGGRMLVGECVIRENLAVVGGGIWIKPGVSNLHLQSTSLCGNEPEQVVGGYSDLGGNTGCGVGCPADLTGDGQVNGADLAILLTSWGPLGGIADLNSDGVVNGTDLSLLLTAWGSCQ
jgi:hypothetical protein